MEKKERGAVAKVRKIAGIVLNVLLYAFLLFSVFVLVTCLVSQKNDGAANIFGYEMRVVVSSSMEHGENSEPTDDYDIKEIKLRSMVFVERVPEDEEKAKEWYASLKKGDVLTFSYYISLQKEIITHRISEITPTETGYIIELKGDNRTGNAEVSTQVIYTSPEDYSDVNGYFNEVIGKVVGQSYVLGNIVYAVSQPVGMALIVIVPCSIVIIWQIFRIISVVAGDRKRKLAEAEKLALTESEKREEQARELEDLKRKIAELEGKGKDGNDGE